MKRIIISVAIGLILNAFAFAQGHTFNNVNTEYTFDLPEDAWKMVVTPTASSPNVEYVYIDRVEGHLEIRKISIGETEIISDLIKREQEQKLQFLPGFVAGKEERFAGNYKGGVFNFEFARAGKNMSGRYYFLRANDSTVYILKFDGYREKLSSIRNQTDYIARTFKLKDK